MCRNEQDMHCLRKPSWLFNVVVVNTNQVHCVVYLVFFGLRSEFRVCMIRENMYYNSVLNLV